MSDKDRSMSNVDAWIELKIRATKLVVKNEPVDYQLFEFIDNIGHKLIEALFLGIDYILSTKNPYSLLERLENSENKVREHTEELEALMKKLGFKGD